MIAVTHKASVITTGCKFRRKYRHPISGAAMEGEAVNIAGCATGTVNGNSVFLACPPSVSSATARDLRARFRGPSVKAIVAIHDVSNAVASGNARLFYRAASPPMESDFA
jgi:hypothetical protein